MAGKGTDHRIAKVIGADGSLMKRRPQSGAVRRLSEAPWLARELPCAAECTAMEVVRHYQNSATQLRSNRSCVTRGGPGMGREFPQQAQPPTVLSVDYGSSFSGPNPFGGRRCSVPAS